MSDTLAYLEKAARNLCVTELCSAFDPSVVKLLPAQNREQGGYGCPS